MHYSVILLTSCKNIWQNLMHDTLKFNMNKSFSVEILIIGLKPLNLLILKYISVRRRDGLIPCKQCSSIFQRQASVIRFRKLSTSAGVYPAYLFINRPHLLYDPPPPSLLHFLLELISLRN